MDQTHSSLNVFAGEKPEKDSFYLEYKKYKKIDINIETSPKNFPSKINP